MKESSKEILKEALSEQMEKEAQAVPPTEDIRREHIFSAVFLEKMRVLIKKQEQMERASGKERAETGECDRIPEDTHTFEQSGEQEEGIACVSAGMRNREPEAEQDEERREEEGAERVPNGKLTRETKAARDKEMQEEKEHRVLTGFSEKLANRTAKRILTAGIVCVILLGIGVFGYQGLLRAGSSSSSDSASVMTAMDDAEEEMMEDTAETTEEKSSEMAEEDSDHVEETENDDARTDSGDDSKNHSESTGTAESGDFCEGAYMTVENVTDHSLTLRLVNSTGEGFTYGDFYEIECYDEGTDSWVLLNAAQDVGFDDVAYLVSDGEECILDVDWTDVYGKLTSGTYRIVKEVQSEADETFYTLTAEFVVE